MSNTSPVFYSGCLRDKGHFVYAPGRPSSIGRGAPEGCPWPYLDSRNLVPPGRMKQGNAVLRHKDGWTVLSIHDYTVDDRPGSNSTFAIASELDFDTMLAAAREDWPEVIERVGPLDLVAIESAAASGETP